MTTIKINERTAKGRNLLKYLREFEGEGFITIVKEPSASLSEAIEEERTGKTKEYKNTKDLFKTLRKKANV